MKLWRFAMRKVRVEERWWMDLTAEQAHVCGLSGAKSRSSNHGRASLPRSPGSPLVSSGRRAAPREVHRGGEGWAKRLDASFAFPLPLATALMTRPLFSGCEGDARQAARPHCRTDRGGRPWDGGAGTGRAWSSAPVSSASWPRRVEELHGADAIAETVVHG